MGQAAAKEKRKQEIEAYLAKQGGIDDETRRKMTKGWTDADWDAMNKESTRRSQEKWDNWVRDNPEDYAKYMKAEDDLVKNDEAKWARIAEKKEKSKKNKNPPVTLSEKDHWNNILNKANLDATSKLVQPSLFQDTLDLEVARVGVMICDVMEEMNKFRDLSLKIEDIMDQSITTTDSEKLTVSDINILVLKNKLIALQSCLQMNKIVVNALDSEKDTQDCSDFLLLHYVYLVLSVLRVSALLVGVHRVPNATQEAAQHASYNTDFKQVCDKVLQALERIGGHEGLFLHFEESMNDPQGRLFGEFQFNFDGDSHGMINSDGYEVWPDSDPVGMALKIESTTWMMDELLYWRNVEDTYIKKSVIESNRINKFDQDLTLIQILKENLATYGEAACKTTPVPRFEKLLEVATSNSFISKAKKVKLTGAHRQDLSLLNENILDVQKELCVLPVDDPIRQELSDDYNSIAAMSEILNLYDPAACKMSPEAMLKHYEAQETAIIARKLAHTNGLANNWGEIEKLNSEVVDLQQKHSVAVANQASGYGGASAASVMGLEEELDLRKNKLRNFKKSMPLGSPLLTSFKKSYESVLHQKIQILNKIEKYVDGVLKKAQPKNLSIPMEVMETTGNEKHREDVKNQMNNLEFMVNSELSDSHYAKKSSYGAEMAKTNDPVLKAYLEAYFALLHDIETLKATHTGVLQRLADVKTEEVPVDEMSEKVLSKRSHREEVCFNTLNGEGGLLSTMREALVKYETVVQGEFNECYQKCVSVYEDLMRLRSSDEGAVSALEHKSKTIKEQLNAVQEELSELQNANTQKINTYREHLREKGLYHSEMPGGDAQNEMALIYERIAGFAPSGTSTSSEDMLDEFRTALEKTEQPLTNTLKTLSDALSKVEAEIQQTAFLLQMGSVSTPLSPNALTKIRIDKVKAYTNLQTEYDAFIAAERTAVLKNFVAEIYGNMVSKHKEALEVDVITREKCADAFSKVVLYVNDITILLKLSRRVVEAIRLISSTMSKCMLNMNDTFVKRLNSEDVIQMLPTLSVFINQTVSDMTSCVDTKVNDSVKGELLATISFINTILANHSQKQGEGVLTNVVMQQNTVLELLDFLEEFQETYNDELTLCVATANSLSNPLKQNGLETAAESLPSAQRKILLMQKKVFQSRVMFGASATDQNIADCRTESGKNQKTAEYILGLVANLQTARDSIVDAIQNYYKIFENELSKNLTTVGSFVSQKSKLTTNENSQASALERVKMITASGISGVYFDKISEYMNDPLVTSVLYSYMSQKNRVVEKILRYNYIYINPLSLIPSFRYKGLVNWLMQNHSVTFDKLSIEMQNGMVLIGLDYLDTMRKNLEEQQEALQFRASLLDEDTDYPAVVQYGTKTVNTFFLEMVVPQLDLNSSSLNLEKGPASTTLTDSKNNIKKLLFVKPPNS
jgi:prefoldin subunit 5